ncbi:MAG TPA: hypothetical protein ENJ06_01395 [Phycisphaeraceae bacterium]|nr:hypothetical protein [Phycisphaeraceae bacterium]
MTFTSPPGILADMEPVVLVGFVQPILMLILTLVWAWFVSDKLDKDATYFHMPRRQWNLAHIIAACVALVIYLYIPQVGPGSSFWLNLPIYAILLAASPLAYIVVRNKKVPEDQRITVSMDKIRGTLEQRRKSKAIRNAALSFKMADGTQYQTPPRDDPAYTVHLGAEEVLLEPLSSRASTVVLAPGRDGQYVLQMVVDGVPRKLQPPQSAPPADIITYFKQLANLDITDKRRKQKAIITAIEGTSQKKIKVVTDGSAKGMRLSLTIDPVKQVNIKVEDLGLLPPQRKAWDELVENGRGVVLVSAGPKQGRTTTLYALISSHDAYLTNVQTLELELERPIEGVRQNVFDPTVEDTDFWTTLRAIMRRDPDVVGVSEMVDPETAKQVALAGLDGPRIYFGIRADNSLQGLQKYIKNVGDPGKAAESLTGLVGVKLLRRLCETCRVPYQPTEEALKKLNLSSSRVKQLYRAGGKVILKGNNPETCPECGGSGYFGQTGVYEILILGDNERDLIASGDLQALRTELRKKRMLFIPDAALMKVIEGETSIEEVNRVLRAQKKPARPKTTSSVKS